MSRPRRRSDEERRRAPHCPPNEGPSLGTIIAGIAGIAGAVGLGYLLGATSREEAEETERAQHPTADRRRAAQQQRQVQQLANHSYYPAQYGSRSHQQHTEVKEATDHTSSSSSSSSFSSSSSSSSSSAAATSAKPVQNSPLGRQPPSSASSSSHDPSVALHPSQSAPLSSAAGIGSGGGEGMREQLEDATLCKICYDAPLDAVLFPCRHQCCCYACSEQLSECPVCRAPFTSAVKIYRS